MKEKGIEVCETVNLKTNMVLSWVLSHLQFVVIFLQLRKLMPDKTWACLRDTHKAGKGLPVHTSCTCLIWT